jgi:DNA topoisomerase-2
LEGGSDYASVRYIFTKFAPYTKKLFDSRDDDILVPSTSPVPTFYVPILPLCLVNGCDGIGTGFSCKIPPYNPVDIKNNIMRILNREPLVKMTPWFRGFNGKITQTDDTTWVCEGIVTKKEEGKYEISELPPGLWTQKFKETLEDSGVKYENYSTETNPKFIVYSDDDFPCPKKVLHTTNMFLITPSGIRKFTSPEEILFEYSKIRLQYYKLRKAAIRNSTQSKLQIMNDKIRFISAVMDGSLKVFGRKKSDIKIDLDALNLPIEILQTRTEEYTHEKITELNAYILELTKKLEELMKTTTADMWKKDLAEL